MRLADVAHLGATRPVRRVLVLAARVPPQVHVVLGGGQVGQTLHAQIAVLAELLAAPLEAPVPLEGSGGVGPEALVVVAALWGQTWAVSWVNYWKIDYWRHSMNTMGILSFISIQKYQFKNIE